MAKWLLVLGGAISAPSAAWGQNVGLAGGPCLFATVEDAVGVAAPGTAVYVREGFVSVEGGYTIGVDVTIETGDAVCAPDPAASPATLDGDGILGPIAIASTVTMSNMRVADHVGTEGGNLLVEGALTLDRVVVLLGTATHGGGVYVAAGGDLTLGSGSALTANLATVHGGGMYVAPGAMATLTDDAQISLNSASDDGGGAYTAGILELRDAPTILLNDAFRGGGIAVVGGDLDASCSPQCDISTNSVVGDSGGGIFGDAGSTLDLVYVAVSNNFAGDTGGGIRSDGVLEMTFGGLFDNRAAWGGGLYASGDVTISDAAITGNHAEYQDGGGLLSLYGTLDLSWVEIGLNEADEAGGGLVIDEGVDAHLGGVWIHDNVAGSDGGGMVVRGDADVQAIGCWFHRNAAAGDGGGLLVEHYLDLRPTVHLDGGMTHQCFESPVVPAMDQYCSELRDNSASRGGGVLLRGGDVGIDRTAFIGNQAATNGLAIHLENEDAPVLELINALVVDHLGAPGQDVVRVGNDTTLDARQVTIAGNTGTPLHYRPTSLGQFVRGIVWDGDDVWIEPASLTATCSSFDGVLGTLAGGSIDLAQDPIFVQTARGRFRLDVLLSPGVDRCSTGNVVDLDSVARFQRIRFDRGAFEMP